MRRARDWDSQASLSPGSQLCGERNVDQMDGGSRVLLTGTDLTPTGVLQRQESLAANLGAKLVGPLILKSFEKLFDGPIKVITPYPFGNEQSPVSWLDVVTFARTSPPDFVLSEFSPGLKTCRFWIKGANVEISEDDWRLVMSGGPERMIPKQPLVEDEAAELGTLNILESRLAMLIKKADTVASKARQLNYHLRGRKAAIRSRKSAEQPGNPDHESRNFSAAPFATTSARPSGEAKMQQNLLEQFSSHHNSRSITLGRPKASRVSTADPTTYTTHNSQEPDPRRLSHPLTSSEDGSEGQYRVLMASKIEKLSRGDTIYPPCDRCRRLKFDCTKHLTACQACTKKHAKCAWKDIKDGELEHVPLMMMGMGGGLSAQQQTPGPEFSPIMMDANLDPGLRGGSGGAGGGIGNGEYHQQWHTHPMMVSREAQGGEERPRERGRDRGTENDHAVLTQIAAAVAGK